MNKTSREYAKPIGIDVESYIHRCLWTNLTPINWIAAEGHMVFYSSYPVLLSYQRFKSMLTLEDCIALSGLTREEIDAIAVHEGLPEIVAAELGGYMVRLPGGSRAIKAIIRDDIAAAQVCGDHLQAAKLKLVLREFARQHGTDMALSSD